MANKPADNKSLLDGYWHSPAPSPVPVFSPKHSPAPSPTLAVPPATITYTSIPPSCATTTSAPVLSYFLAFALSWIFFVD